MLHGEPGKESMAEAELGVMAETKGKQSQGWPQILDQDTCSSICGADTRSVQALILSTYFVLMNN